MCIDEPPSKKWKNQSYVNFYSLKVRRNEFNNYFNWNFRIIVNLSSTFLFTDSGSSMSSNTLIIHIAKKSFQLTQLDKKSLYNNFKSFRSRSVDDDLSTYFIYFRFFFFDGGSSNFDNMY